MRDKILRSITAQTIVWAFLSFAYLFVYAIGIAIAKISSSTVEASIYIALIFPMLVSWMVYGPGPQGAGSKSDMDALLDKERRQFRAHGFTEREFQEYVNIRDQAMVYLSRTYRENWIACRVAGSEIITDALKKSITLAELGDIRNRYTWKTFTVADYLLRKTWIVLKGVRERRWR